MEPQLETIQIAASTAAKLRERAEAQGMTIEEFLREVAGETNGHEGEKALKPTLYELAEDIIGSIDSSVPDPDPDAQPRRTILGQLVAEDLRRQGLKVP
jgi:hypothetical protein